MGVFKKFTMVSAAALVALLAVGVGSAVAASRLADFKWTVTGLEPGSQLQVLYKGGVTEAVKGMASSKSGYTVVLGKGIALVQNSRGPTTIEQWLQVDSERLTGTAVVPAGASLSVIDNLTGARTTVANGSFSIPTGLRRAASETGRGSGETIECNGGAESCLATVPIGRGASDRHLVIKLTDTNMKLDSATAVPESASGGYVLTDGHFTEGGSEYRVTLNAAEANPDDAHLKIKFATGN
jgi:hypothetical protein